MSSDDQPLGLADDLAARSDDALADLLAQRPDLASPPPQGTAVLAQRALTAASMTLAGEGLDLLTLAVVEQVMAVAGAAGRGPLPATTTAADIVDALSDRADAAEITDRIELLLARALLWGEHEALVWGAHLGATLPWKALHLTGPLAHTSPAELRALIDSVDDRQRELLTTLARGPALGRSRDAAPGADPDSPVARLIALGLLARIDDQTVELPPMVGRLLREEPPLRTDELSRPPLVDETVSRRFSAREVDEAAGGEALEAIRHATSILGALAATPAAVLRSGALGVRELRRLAKVTGLDQKRLAFLIEILGHARLIDIGFPEPPPPGDRGEQAFAPTNAADAWLHSAPERQWATLLDAWLTMPRRAWQVGEPDRDGNAYPALSSELYDATAAGQRHLVLATLAGSAPAAPFSIATVSALLAWLHPHQMRRLTTHLIDETLSEARHLGVVAHHCLTSVGRLASSHTEAEGDSALVAAMRKALPEPVDHFLTQADLTLTVPGPMAADLAEQVELVADLESGGAASVYRVSESSVRRALDAGRTSSELLTLFTTRSRTPVPQSLTYLVEDVARRHGQLRVGIASSFIRCEDPTMLAAVLRSDAADHLALRALAPTVAVSPSEVRDVIDRLREAGFAPAGEDSSGALVDLRDRGSRVSAARGRRHPVPRRSAPTAEQLRSVVSRMRSHDRATRAAPTAGTRSAPVRAVGGGESATALIQLALRANRRLRIGYVDAHGSASRHVVTPRILGAGQLVGVEDGGDDEQRFTLHRITSVELLDT
ncbi:helicase-associated domain-containing protein [Gordonia sp. NPDC003425]